MSDSKHADGLDRALHAALARTLAPPAVPAHFRQNLEAALVRAADTSITDLRSRFELEQQKKLAQLDQDYVRLRRRTLGTMIGGAFAAGALAALALPWLTARLGPAAPLMVASVGAIIGIGIGISYWLSSPAPSDPRVQS